MEVYLTCSGTQTISGNTFVGNALNGLFVASGTVNITNNVFQANTIGVIALRDQRRSARSRATRTRSSRFYGNTFDSNVRVGIFSERASGQRHPRRVRDGGRHGTGQKNFFRNYAPPKFHAIGCYNDDDECHVPAQRQHFDHSGDDVEQPACNTACVSTP